MHKFGYICCLGIWLLTLAGCHQQKSKVPVIGFVEAFEDATIADARKGFVKALADSGFSEDAKSVKIDYRNAQGDAGTLNQIISYFINEPVALIGTSTTLATMAAVQRNKKIPVFMTVTAMPHILGLLDKNGNPPSNLFGTGEELNYIDTSFTLIPKTLKPVDGSKLRIGMIYNQSEPQSVDAYKRIDSLAEVAGVSLIAMPLNNSAEAQLVTKALLAKKIDAFFANPDNTVFAAFEVILKNCDEQHVPVFTSEAGLVKRGAVAAFGADIYQWGYQSGAQAAAYLKGRNRTGTAGSHPLKVTLLTLRKSVYNPQAAAKYGLHFPDSFKSVNETAVK
ncbi:putative ABC transport system substrate-binding protein [bacterium A37T11]|nr:putative ABC transport system substrate-binding protein [bacterium A37T11]